MLRGWRQEAVQVMMCVYVGAGMGGSVQGTTHGNF